MIRVTVELVPYSCPERPEKLGEMVIANDGTGTPTDGHYTTRVRGKNYRWRFGRVFHFPRQRLNVWHLVGRALDEMGYTE